MNCLKAIGGEEAPKTGYSVVKRPNNLFLAKKKPSRREGTKGMGILETAISACGGWEL
jgi:hypothetical protein